MISSVPSSFCDLSLISHREHFLSATGDEGRGSQSGSLPLRGHGRTSRDISGCRNWGTGWVETGHAALCLQRTGQPPTTENYAAQDADGGAADQPGLRV